MTWRQRDEFIARLVREGKLPHPESDAAYEFLAPGARKGPKDCCGYKAGPFRVSFPVGGGRIEEVDAWLVEVSYYASPVPF
jgi:hypothetical protein